MSKISNQLPATSAEQNPPIYPKLELETRSHIGTDQAAYYLLRKPQTLRMWSALEPEGGIIPTRVNGRLAWSVAAIRALLQGDAK